MVVSSAFTIPETRKHAYAGLADVPRCRTTEHY